MSVWPPDGQFRVTVAQGSQGLPVVPIGGAGGVYLQPAPAPGVLSGNVFQAVTAQQTGVSASGSTAVWTPTAGTRFNLEGWLLVVTGNASRGSAASTTFQLRDGATTVFASTACFVPGAAGTAMGADFTPGWVMYSPPYRSAAVNNVLNLNLAVALVNGGASLHVMGFETT